MNEQISYIYANAYKTYKTMFFKHFTNRKCKHEIKNITIDLFCIRFLFVVKINCISFAELRVFCKNRFIGVVLGYLSGFKSLIVSGNLVVG